MMRIFGLVAILLVTFCRAWASSAIVLIAPSAAGPNVWSEIESHPLWVTWPSPTDGSGVNQLVSIVTRSEPSVTSQNFSFRSLGSNRMTNTEHDSLIKFNIPVPEYKRIVPLALGGYGVEQELLSMAASQSAEINYVWQTEDSSSDVYAVRAMTWDEVAAVSRTVTGTTIVIEFPSALNRRYSRMWLYSYGRVESRQPVGVVRSTSVLGLTSSPQFGPVNPGNSMRSGAPDRWLSLGQSTRVVLLGLYILVWASVFASLGYLSAERGGVPSRAPMYFALAMVFAIRLLPILLTWSGVGMCWFWMTTLTGGIFAMFIGADHLSRNGPRDSVALIASSMFMISGLIPATMNPFGPTYGLEFDLVRMNDGLGLVLATYLFLTMFGRSGFAWVLAMLVFPTIILVFRFLPYSTLEAAIAFVTLAFVFPARWAKVLGAVSLAVLLGIGFSDHGWQLSWHPYQVVDRFDRPNPINYFDAFAALVRPQFGLGLLASVASIVFASRFESHRMMKAWKELDSVKPMVGVNFIVLAVSIANPSYLGVLPWTIAFSCLFWAQEALRQLA